MLINFGYFAIIGQLFLLARLPLLNHVLPNNFLSQIELENGVKGGRRHASSLHFICIFGLFTPNYSDFADRTISIDYRGFSPHRFGVARSHALAN
jgi:hypothetical protein